MICVELETNVYSDKFSSKGCQYVTTNIAKFTDTSKQDIYAY